jgi:hypothetical protein
MFKNVEEMSIEEANAEISETMKNPSSDYFNSSSFGHKGAVARMASLYGKVHPEDSSRANMPPEKRDLADRLSRAGVTQETIENTPTMEDHLAKQAREQAERTLRTELGDQYESTVTAAKEVLKQYATEDDMRLIEETGAGNDPELIKALATVHRILGNG